MGTSWLCHTHFLQLLWPNLSRSIVTDRQGKGFHQWILAGIVHINGTKLHLNSTYHPQTDGQTESLNQCLEMYLRCRTFHQPRQWVSWLSLGEWWYNTTYHAAIKMSPFEALYGIKPPQLALGPYQQTNVAEIE